MIESDYKNVCACLTGPDFRTKDERRARSISPIETKATVCTDTSKLAEAIYF